MIKRIDHIAIAVDNLDESIKLYKKILGMIPKKYKVIYIGNSYDYEVGLRNLEKHRGKAILNKIIKCASLLTHADHVISNDTGWYHAAGALNKKTFVMWKDTPFEKNWSPGKDVFYSRKGNWTSDFKEWIC